MRVYEILPGTIYIGPAFDKRPLEWKRDFVARHGFRSVLCLRPRYDDDMPGLVNDYEMIPIKDGKLDDANMSMVERAVDTAMDMACEQAPLYIHCIAGRNRSGLVAALLYRTLEQVSGLEALEHVQRVRPNSLYNEHFAQHLRSLS